MAAERKNHLIAVLGQSGSGKSTFINEVSGSKLQVGSDLESCTSIVEAAEPFELDQDLVTLIDTPGFDDSSRSDTDILATNAAYLASLYERGEKLSGIIFMHRISDFRVSGVARQNIVMFQKLCGADALQNVAIVTNMWGKVDTAVGERRERQLASSDKFFKPALDNDAQMFRHDNGLSSAQAIVRHLIHKEPVPLRIQQELVDERLEILETAAGIELNKQILEKAKKHKADMLKLEERMAAAIRAKDEDAKKTLEETRRQRQADIERAENDAARLAKGYHAEKSRLYETMRKMEIEAETRRRHTQELMQQTQSRLDAARAEMQAKADTERLKAQERQEDLEAMWPPQADTDSETESTAANPARHPPYSRKPKYLIVENLRHVVSLLWRLIGEVGTASSAMGWVRRVLVMPLTWFFKGSDRA